MTERLKVRIAFYAGVFLSLCVSASVASAQSKSFSVVPDFGQNSGSIIGSGNGGNKPAAESVIPVIIGGIASGGFGQVPQGQGGSPVIGGAGAGSGGAAGGQDGANGAGGPVGGSAPPFGMVEQVKELTGSNGVATQSVMQGASNLTAAARSVQGMK